ncbi:MAG: zinc carboxypeptidase, partial [Synechococcaceae bacterium WB9_4xB_025]|nr:zinc carboxypeptidase [Synechococcaceae bacterium WB9_4xB_025]
MVWLSYNIHGNEVSSSEAAMLTLYNLVDPTNEQAAEWLKDVVVIIDPMLNPDGRDRYVNWFHQMAGERYNPEHIAREHHEPWPGGRPNH